MPRQPRTSSGTGIYHVMLRGINRQDIFEEQEDYQQFSSTPTENRISWLYEHGRIPEMSENEVKLEFTEFISRRTSR